MAILLDQEKDCIRRIFENDAADGRFLTEILGWGEGSPFVVWKEEGWMCVRLLKEGEFTTKDSNREFEEDL